MQYIFLWVHLVLCRRSVFRTMRECDIFSRPGKRCGKVYCDERNVSQLLLKGCRNRSQTLNLHNLSEFTIGELKNIVHEKTGIDADEMLLNFGAKRLSDGRLSLDSYSLKSGSVIAMATRSVIVLASHQNQEFIHQIKNDGHRTQLSADVSRCIFWVAVIESRIIAFCSTRAKRFLYSL